MPFENPPDIAEETVQRILERIADGQSLKGACEAEGVRRSAFNANLARNATLGDRYAKAKFVGLDNMADDIISLSDECRIGERRKVVTDDGLTKEEVITADMVERSKIQCDNRKWLLGRLYPSKYGDRLALAGDPNQPIQINLTETDMKL